MNRFRIPATIALLVGIVMAIWGGRLSLNQQNLAEQTTGEWILSIALTVGGVLIALIAAFAPFYHPDAYK